MRQWRSMTTPSPNSGKSTEPASPVLSKDSATDLTPSRSLKPGNSLSGSLLTRSEIDFLRQDLQESYRTGKIYLKELQAQKAGQ